MISHETRRESHKSVDKKKICDVILKIMRSEDRPLTAWHIAELCNMEITTVRPRLTEMASHEYCKKNLQSPPLIMQHGIGYHHKSNKRLTTYMTIPTSYHSGFLF